MIGKAPRKAYSAFIGSLTLTVCLASYLSYLTVPGSDVRVWLLLSILSIALQTIITGQQGFEHRPSLDQENSNAIQDENYFYCGATFEDEKDPKDEIFNPVFSRELMAWRVAGLGALVASYFFCLKKLPGFHFNISDLAFLLGLTVILYASTLRHFLLALALFSWVVMVHQISGIERSNSIPWVQWLLLGGYAFLVILTLQLHRILDLEINDPEADLLKHPGKRQELVIGSLGWLAFGASLVILCNQVVPQKPERNTPQQSVKIPGNKALQDGLATAGQKLAEQVSEHVSESSKKVAISQADAMRLLQSLQSKAETAPDPNSALNINAKVNLGTGAGVDARASANVNSNLPANANVSASAVEAAMKQSSEISLPSKLELEGLIRKDLESSAARPDQQVELSKETIASIQQALEQQPKQPQKNTEPLKDSPASASFEKHQQPSLSQDPGKKSDLRAALENVQSQVSSQMKAQPNERKSSDATAASLPEPGKPASLALPQSAPEKNFDQPFQIFRRVLVLIALFVLVGFFSKLVRKRARPEEIHPSAVKLSDEERAKLKKEWKALQKQSLSAREEVIASYHFFLKVMSSFGHSRPDSLPPSEYADSLQPFFVPQSKPIGRLTTVFCDVFYGKEDPDPTHLKEFRADFGSICRNLL